MQKTLIKSILAVAVAGTFATYANAAVPNARNDWYAPFGIPIGFIDTTKVQENFDDLDTRVDAKLNTADFNTAKTELTGKINTAKSEAVADAKTYTDTTVDTAKTELTGKINTAKSEAVADAKTYTDTTVDTAKTELTGKINTAKSEAVADAKTYTDTTVDTAKTELTGKINTAKSEAVADAKTYTDTTVDTAKSELNGKIGDNRTAINKNRADIDRNTATIASHYAEMKNNFAAVNTRIDTLDKKMKRGFASQAALNGLFQPYNVGKFNVTAAIGGYDSEQAMAIGTGYRFNENIAVKAGIASDLGAFDHITYNVGVNFEF